MNKCKFAIFCFIVSISLSSCVYYKDMPKEWARQTSKINDCTIFNGIYRLSDDNKTISTDNEYNDLRYFQNTPIYGRERIVISGLTNIEIQVTHDAVKIRFFAGKKQVHISHFDKESFECTSNFLSLNLKNQTASGGLVVMYYIAPTVTMYKSKTNDVFVKRQETSSGVVIIVPAIAGKNIWFKLKKIGNITNR